MHLSIRSAVLLLIVAVPATAATAGSVVVIDSLTTKNTTVSGGVAVLTDSTRPRPGGLRKDPLTLKQAATRGLGRGLTCEYFMEEGQDYCVVEIKVYHGSSGHHDGTCLDASGRSDNGGKVHTWECSNGIWSGLNKNGINKNQHWLFNPTTKQIKAAYSDKCLDGERTKWGGKVHMWDCNTANKNQQWEYNASTLQIKAVHGFCLDASQRKKNEGKVHMVPCNPRNYNQIWELRIGWAPNQPPVWCGGHSASSCVNCPCTAGDFPQSQCSTSSWAGAGWCNGQCAWDGGACHGPW